MEDINKITTLTATLDALNRAGEANAIKIVVEKLLELINKI